MPLRSQAKGTALNEETGGWDRRWREEQEWVPADELCDEEGRQKKQSRGGGDSEGGEGWGRRWRDWG
eukprot:3941499-Rhodomonas_salina.2